MLEVVVLITELIIGPRTLPSSKALLPRSLRSRHPDIPLLAQEVLLLVRLFVELLVGQLVVAIQHEARAELVPVRCLEEGECVERMQPAIATT